MNFADALQGQVAGMQVFTSSGEPTATSSMRVRGYTSLNAGTSPLYILDGAPVSNDVFTSLNPNDIENVTTIDYLFKNSKDNEIIVQEYLQDENLEFTQIYESDKQIDSKKGKIYISEDSGINNAIIQIDDGIMVYIWTTLSHNEIIKIVDAIKY